MIEDEMAEITNSMDISLSKLQEMVKDREAWHASVQGGGKELDTNEWLNNNQTVFRSGCINFYSHQ